MLKLNRMFLSQNISVDNALSMNQILHQIINQMKEIVDFINNLELRANEYTDQEILKLKNNLESQLTTLEQTLKTYTDDKIDEYNVEVINPQLQTIRDTIDTLNRTLNDRITDEVGILNRRINSEVSTLNRIIEETKTYLEDLIKKGMAYVYSSISGRQLPLQVVLGEIGYALKHILNYDWNTINNFKYIQRGWYINLKHFNLTNTTPMGDELFSKGIYYDDIDEEDGHKYIYIKKLSGESYWDDKPINETAYVSYGISDSRDVLGTVTGPITVTKIATDIIRYDITNVSMENHHFINIPLSIYTTEYIDFYDNLENAKIYYGDIDNPYYISFDSLKGAMEYKHYSYNNLIYTGVNGWNILNDTEQLFNVSNVKSDYLEHFTPINVLFQDDEKFYKLKEGE